MYYREISAFKNARMKCSRDQVARVVDKDFEY